MALEKKTGITHDHVLFLQFRNFLASFFVRFRRHSTHHGKPKRDVCVKLASVFPGTQLRSSSSSLKRFFYRIDIASKEIWHSFYLKTAKKFKNHTIFKTFFFIILQFQTNNVLKIKIFQIFLFSTILYANFFTFFWEESCKFIFCWWICKNVVFSKRKGTLTFGFVPGAYAHVPFSLKAA